MREIVTTTAFRKIVTTTAFRKDVKRMRKRGKDLAKLERVVELLVIDTELEPGLKPHPLTGNWRPLWDLHIEPDWLLICEVTEAEVFLARTGTHADLLNTSTSTVELEKCFVPGMFVNADLPR